MLNSTEASSIYNSLSLLNTVYTQIESQGCSPPDPEYSELIDLLIEILIFYDKYRIIYECDEDYLDNVLRGYYFVPYEDLIQDDPKLILALFLEQFYVHDLDLPSTLNLLASFRLIPFELPIIASKLFTLSHFLYDYSYQTRKTPIEYISTEIDSPLLSFNNLR